MTKKKYKYVDFGNHLRKINREKFKDINVFSKSVDIPSSTLYDYEIGRIFPPIEKFIRICKTLNKSPEYMLSTLLDMGVKDKKILEIIERVKNVCQIEGHVNKLDGYLSALEQGIERKEKRG